MPYIDSGGEKCSHIVVGIASQGSILLWVEFLVFLHGMGSKSLDRGMSTRP